MSKILFWDFDGTLSHTNKSFFTALHASLCNIGYHFEAEDSAKFLNTAYSWKTPQTEYANKVKDMWWDTLFEKIRLFCAERGVAAADMEKISVGFKENLIDVSNYTLYEDTAATLEKCVELGYRNYLITNNYPEITDNLEKLGIGKYFTDFIVSSHIGYEKPRKEFFEYARKLAGIEEGGYVIGDNPIADIGGGSEAGFTTIAVHECQNSAADYYVENLIEIFKIL